MVVVSRAVVLLCVTAAAVLSAVPDARVGAELVPRQLEQEALKVHVKLHQNEAVPQPQPENRASTKKHHSHHKKEEAEEAAANSETVRNYDHGTVRIESNDTPPAKKPAKGHRQKDANDQAPTDETIVQYNLGSVKISSKKASVTTGGETKRTKDKAKKAAAPNEKEVTSTANDVNELVTKLSSTDSANKKTFIDAYGPVVVICGIIVGLAAIIGVAGFVMGEPKSDSAPLDNSADLDVDVEANITSADIQDAADDSEDSLDGSDAEEEEGTFANGAPHVSV
ncbi:hypothetical protein PF010_g138 [Phytophthora fragariae]|uniref:RxLR effector protein n=1 Tax=Phytophthora fragariae TaxID=53985 RepID=A0A6G0PW18_9STRA|nr:hypothetical protein PF010_g138 [Phytophthora fragariae]KAE9256283.1 hypothetical protein PF004_g185 [Phytophthora fragariae]